MNKFFGNYFRRHEYNKLQTNFNFHGDVGRHFDQGMYIDDTHAIDKQSQAGWGAKIIDLLAKDLRETFPDIKGFSSRNLNYMRAFAAAWLEREFVQEFLAQITWYHNIGLLEISFSYFPALSVSSVSKPALSPGAKQPAFTWNHKKNINDKTVRLLILDDFISVF